ncbi:MAG: hypothetical protein L0322_00840, partial [Chloroflexi bacterium]|nr:hypothetical protein [Chloroflexota bacterium]
ARLESTDHMFAASHGAVISNRVVNELRFQFARRDQLVLSLDPTCGVSWGDDGFGNGRGREDRPRCYSGVG